MKITLTKATLAQLRPSEKDYVAWDARLPGFGIRVLPSGVKSYILQYRNLQGRSRRTTLGTVGVVTLDRARREAKKLRGAVTFGADPAADRFAARNVDTVRELAARYMDDHCAGRCKESTIAAHKWLLKKFILPAFGARRLSELATGDISRFHQSLRATPYNANRSLGLIKAMFSQAEQWGLIPANSSPARPIRPFKERKRQRYLSPEEFTLLFASIDKCEHLQTIDVHQAAAIRLLALTGCRLSEILKLRWEDVDFGNRRLNIERHKTEDGGVKSIPLNDAAHRILREHIKVAGNPHVICGRNKGHHLVNLRKPWRRVLEDAGLANLRLHDLRHSFASAAASSGVSIQIVGALLGHASMQSTSRYSHLYDDPLRQASNKISDVMGAT